MKSFIFCCFVVVLVTTTASADFGEKLMENSVDSSKASDKSSVSKPKRDASLLLGSGYHGPSYKYLPPTSASSVYDSYGGAHHGLGGSYASSGIGGGHSGGHSSGHHHAHHAGHGYSGHSLGHSGHSGYGGHSAHSGLPGFKLSGHSHGFAGVPSPAFTGGHSFASSLGGHGYATGASSGGHHHLHSSGHGLSSGHGSLGPVYTAGHGVLSAGPSFSSSHGSSAGHNGHAGHNVHSGHGGHAAHAGHSYITSASLGGANSGHKVLTSHSNVPSYSLSAGQVGTAAGLATGYQYAKGISGSLPGSLHFAGSSHLGSSGGVGSFTNHGFASSGLAGNDLHHSDHVHNGNQEHHYVVTAGHDASSVGHAGSQGLSALDGYHYETPSPTYLTATIQQHHVQPSNSYGVPLATVGAAYSPNYHNQGSADESPNYAAGHKGLGHFSYTANKPNVLHTSFIDSAYKTPNYSNAPFKPSTFLGTKYEGSSFAGESSAVGHNPSQQYLPPSGVGADSTGYDYPVPSSGALVYQSSADNATPIHEPESTYLPPNNLESSYNDVSNNPSANYLPPNGQSSYGTSH